MLGTPYSLDAPASENSPMNFAMLNGGKVLFFGCGMGSNTFLHFLEHKANSDFLQNAIVKLIDDNGTLKTEVIKKHLPGHRDFYSDKAGNCKFYTRAKEKGLTIKSTSLGLGMLYLMDLNELYNIGIKLFYEDPNITLCCDNPDCTFCRNYKK